MRAIGQSGRVQAGVRGRREQRLWPLAVIPLLGVLILGGALIAASRTAPRRSEQPAESHLLDSLTVDARLVTPPGTREARLTRYAVCPQGEGSSAATRVDRDLRLQPNASGATAQAEILGQYARLGWVRDPYGLPGTLNKGTRSLDITGSFNDGPDLLVTVSFDSDACA